MAEQVHLNLKLLIVLMGFIWVAVTGMTTNGIGYDQLRVSWRAPSNNSDIHYLVTYELINLEQCQEGDLSRDSLVTTETSVIIQGLKAYSTYRVTVTSTNGNGMTETSSVITGERSLGIAPTFQSSRVTASSIGITWNPIPCGSRGVRILGYRVDLSRSGQSQAIQSRNVQTTSVQFEHLSPCTSYTITVTTSSRGGTTSFYRRERTKAIAPDAVTVLNKAKIRHSQLSTSWRAPGTSPDNPCLATDYLVTYELVILDQCQEGDHSIGSLNTTDTSVIIRRLKAYSTYRVNVTSRNEAGNGTTQTFFKVTGEKSLGLAPTLNSSRVNASSIGITWNPIPCGSRGGKITGYRTELYLAGRSHRLGYVNTRTTSVQFDHLSPCTSYIITVTTLSRGGTTSFNQREKTKAAAPGRMTMLRANATANSTEVRITWQNPTANNCPVSNFTVEYQLLNRDQCDSSLLPDRKRWLLGTQSPTTITGLYPHSTYRVYVTPFNHVGTGEEKSVKGKTNPSAPTGPPLGLMSSNVTNQTVVFSWRQPACGQRNGIITQYYYSLTHSEDQILREDTISSTRVEFTGLVPFTLYTLSVSAWNQIASGPAASNTTLTKDGIPTPPSNVTFPVIRSNRITVSWFRPNPSHGIIISYEIRYWKTESENSSSAEIVRVTDDLQNDLQTKEITNLEGTVSYSFQILGETRGGFGAWSNVSTSFTLPQSVTKSQAVPTRPVILLIISFYLAGAAVVVVVLGILFYLQRRCKRRRRNPQRHREVNSGQELVSYENVLPKEEKTNSSSEHKGCLVQESVYEEVDCDSSARPSPEPTHENIALPKWAQPWSVLWGDLVVENKVLGNGHFGEVRYGVVKVTRKVCKAAIRKLKENASPADKENFLTELKTMTLHGSHPNLVKILGACQHEGILYVASEYLSNGDLRSYLIKARSMVNDGNASLSTQKLLQFALGVAKGMKHLAASRVIHRDLAARNILLDDDLIAKVSDFGLSRGEDVYVQKTRVPTRWLSLESLTHQTYTPKSDVWSFGILLWEIITLGETPYPGIKTKLLTSRLQNGYRMPKPSNCDGNIYDVMLQCWQRDPSDRPSFKKLVSVFETMADSYAYQEPTCVHLSPSSEMNLYVNTRPVLHDI